MINRAEIGYFMIFRYYSGCNRLTKRLRKSYEDQTQD
jgi:hypothetical protein